jgi:hypothetical protein
MTVERLGISKRRGLEVLAILSAEARTGRKSRNLNRNENEEMD